MLFKRSKIILALFLITVILYFTSDFQLVDIEKTAIIAALGIDYIDESNISVTAQIAIPQANDSASTNSDAIITSKGKTVFSALDNIASQTGWHPKLTFCNLIVFGNQLLQHDFMPIVDFLLSSNRFQNSAILAGAQKTAKEVLSSYTPLDYISSFALQKILLKNLDKASPVLIVDIKDFASSSKSKSQFCYMPLIKIIETDDKGKGNKEQSEAVFAPENLSLSNDIKLTKQEKEEGKSSKKEGGSEDKTSTKSTVFDTTNTNIFNNGKLCCVFSKEQTHCYNLIFKKVRESFFSISFKKDEKTIDSVITIVKNKVKRKVTIENGKPVFEIKIDLFCEKEDNFSKENINGLKNFSKVSKEGLYALKQKIESTIIEMAQISKELNCDFFEIKELFYQTNYPYYKEFEKDILSKIEIKVNVNCKNHK